MAHDVLTTSFADHFGFVPAAYETWHDKQAGRSTFDASQLWVTEVDGQPAGLLLYNDQFVADEGCGYVSHIGVPAREVRPRIAKQLLPARARDATPTRSWVRGFVATPELCGSCEWIRVGPGVAGGWLRSVLLTLRWWIKVWGFGKQPGGSGWIIG